ncbi:MAG: pilus assembly PilX N-terminal domain-containing protein [Burkholderiaceae bacterium]
MRPIAFSHRPRAQRGVAALVITVLLFFTMVLASVYLNRNLVFEQRSSANQYRATQAFEAAEAGLEWATALLNSNQRIGPDCLAAATSATSFRDRFIGNDRATSRLSGRSVGGAALQAACVRAGAGWSCACPSDGPPVLAASNADNAPAFILEFLGGDKPGVLRVVSTGCSSLAGACAATAADARTRPDATAKVEVSFGLLPAVAALPVAALTARGSVDAGNAALGLHNADPATGVAVHAGTSVSATLARITVPAGASVATSVVEGDAELAALVPERLFTSLFGIDKLAWKNQPVVRRVACPGDCTGAVVSAIDAGVVNQMLWVSSTVGTPMRIVGPITLGTPERPVVIVVDGPLHLSGTVRVHGMLYAASLTWTDAPAPGALVRGAVVVEGGYTGDAAADLVYDATLLATLKSTTGALVRINGSWRDY